MCPRDFMGSFRSRRQIQKSRLNTPNTLEAHRREGILVLRVNGRLMLDDGCQELREAITVALDEGIRHVVLVLDLSDFDSAGLGEVIGCARVIRRREGRVAVCHQPALMTQLLAVTGMGSWAGCGAELYENESAAFSAFEHA